MSRFTLAEYREHKEDIKNGDYSTGAGGFTPDHAFDILEEILGIENIGYIAVVDGVIELKQENSMLRDLLQDRMPVGCIAETTYQPILEENENLKEEVEKLKEENKKLQELTDGIMNESNTGHIQGTNAYEKFCQAMCELNYDEKWITEHKEENKKLKWDCEQMGKSPWVGTPACDKMLKLIGENKELKEENKKLKEEGGTNQRRATIYEYMSEFMEKSDSYGAYFDYIREYYPDEREAAAVPSDEEEDTSSSEEEEEIEEVKEELPSCGWASWPRDLREYYTELLELRKENKKLKEEVVNKEETLEQVRDYINGGS